SHLSDIKRRLHSRRALASCKTYRVQPDCHASSSQKVPNRTSWRPDRLWLPVRPSKNCRVRVPVAVVFLLHSFSVFSFILNIDNCSSIRLQTLSASAEKSQSRGFQVVLV